MVFLKHEYISNPKFTPADAVLAAAQDMADSLQSRMQFHLDNDALQALLNLQKMFSQAATTQKAEDNPQPEPPQTKQTHLLAPKPTPAPENLLVVLPFGPQPLRNAAPPPRMSLIRPPLRVAMPLHPSPPAPSETTPRKVLTRPNGPGVAPPRRAPTVPTDRSAAPPVTNVAPSRRSPRVAALNIKRQAIGEVGATSPIDNDKNLPADNTRSKKLSFHAPKKRYSPVLTSANTDSVPGQYPKEVLTSVLNKETGELMDYRHLIGNPRYRALWSKSYVNKLGRLLQVMPGRVKGIDTIFFINKANIPSYCCKDVTYGRIFVSYRPEKSEPNCTRLTVGGDRVNYYGDCGTLTTDILNFKFLLNITISTLGDRFMTIDIKDFYLMAPMD